jgi:Rrf2 family protein
MRDIARRQGISRKYLWQVITPLRSAGLLHAIRGARGGYVLARRPEAISVLDIVSILEGAGFVVACVTAPESCRRSAACVAREAWAEIEGKLTDAMRAITLRDLIQRHRERESRGGSSYAI